MSGWSIFRWSEGRPWQFDRFPWFVIWMSLVIFLIGPHSSRHKIVHTRAVVLISLKFISSFQLSACMTSEKGLFWFSMIPTQEDGRKIGNVSMESCSQILEESRIVQDLVWFGGRNSETINSTRFWYPQRCIIVSNETEFFLLQSPKFLSEITKIRLICL